MKRAEESDLSRILDMMERFASARDVEIRRQDCAQVMLDLIFNQFVAVSAKGFIAGMIQRNPLNTSEIWANEFLWWAEDGSGPKLARAFKRWAKRHGAQKIRWSCPADNERVQRFYSRIGTRDEVIFVETL